jgi:hypothetical protein
VEHFKEGDEYPTRLCTLHKGNLKQQVHRTLQGLFGGLTRGLGGIFR